VALLRYLFVTGWAVWLGSIVFFSFVIAPTAFTALGREGAAPLMRALFPRYYLLGLISGGVMLVTALTLGAELRITIPLVIALVLVAYARQVVTPSVNRARDSHDEQRFARLHRLSVQMNLVVLCLLLLIGSVIARLARGA
jgi:hypothetical protein